MEMKCGIESMLANTEPQRSVNTVISQSVEDAPGAGTRPLMRVRGLRKAFGGHVVLDEVSLDLHEGEVVLLRGDNGSGKTTLLNILTGNLEPDRGSIWLNADGSEENFQFPFPWWQETNPFNHFTPERVANEAIGRTWQDIRLFKSTNLTDNLAVATPGQPGENPFIALVHNGSARRCEVANQRECQALLASIGLGDRADSSADKISLGQTKRVAIARAIHAGARILFLDEPLAGLDADGIADVMALLASLAQRERVTLVIVEHVFNIPRILCLAQTVWTLRDGKVEVEAARHVSTDGDSVFRSVLQKLLEEFAGPGRELREQPLAGGKMIISSRRPAEEKAPLLEVQSLAVRRNGRLVIGHELPNRTIAGVSFTLRVGDVGIIYAPNGWGKTTILEAIAGVIPVVEGHLLLQGIDARTLPPWQRARLGLRLTPARNSLFPSLSVADFLALRHLPLTEADGLGNPSRLIGELSGGERQLLALTDLSVPGTLVLLDEPFLGLDSEAVRATGKRLRAFVDRMSGSLLIALPSAIGPDDLATLDLFHN